MKQTGTLFLKIVLAIIGLSVLALCIFGIPSLILGIVGYIGISALKYPLFIDIYLTAIIFFYALYNAFKLLTYIDQNRAFSPQSVEALKNIKYCGIGICILYILCLPVVILASDKDDAPGGVVIGMALAMAPLVVSVFAAVLQKLIQNGMDIKSENDLTV